MQTAGSALGLAKTVQTDAGASQFVLETPGPERYSGQTVAPSVALSTTNAGTVAVELVEVVVVLLFPVEVEVVVLEEVVALVDDVPTLVELSAGKGMTPRATGLCTRGTAEGEEITTPEAPIIIKATRAESELAVLTPKLNPVTIVIFASHSYAFAATTSRHATLGALQQPSLNACSGIRYE